MLPVVTLGAQTETGCIFNEAVNSGPPPPPPPPRSAAEWPTFLHLAESQKNQSDEQISQELPLITKPAG